MTMRDDKFLQAFEAKTLPVEDFDHFGHLRLAWIYLDCYPLHGAIERITRTIPAYAAHWGATGKFHRTLTEAIVRIMAVRIEQQKPVTLDQFLLNNSDLVNNLHNVVLGYYSEALLNSEKAKNFFIMPDLKPLLFMSGHQPNQSSS